MSLPYHPIKGNFSEPEHATKGNSMKAQHAEVSLKIRSLPCAVFKHDRGV